MSGDRQRVNKHDQQMGNEEVVSEGCLQTRQLHTWRQNEAARTGRMANGNK